MKIQRHIARAIRQWLAWRREQEWMRENGIQTLTTRIKVKAERHQSTERERSRLSQIVHSDIASSLGIDWQPPVKPEQAGTAKLKQELAQ